MECAQKADFGYFGSIFFIGVVLASLTVPRLSDIIGRKKIVIFGLALHLIAGFAIMFTSSPYLAYALQFMMGFDFGGRVLVAYVFMSEHMRV